MGWKTNQMRASRQNLRYGNGDEAIPSAIRMMIPMD
jgi:hypothetical protein